MNEQSPHPTESQAVAAATDGRVGAERSSLQRVLLVTDRARERHVLMSALETLPVATAFASSRYDALRLAETLRPDVIVVEAELRGNEGWEICEEILGAQDGAAETGGGSGSFWVPSFILLHGDRDDSIERAKALGLDQLLRWPFAVDEARSLLEIQLAEPAYGSGGFSTEGVVSDGPAVVAPGLPDQDADPSVVASTAGVPAPATGEIETPAYGWPPLKLDSAETPHPEESLNSGRAADAHSGDDDEVGPGEPGNAHAAIAMLEPKTPPATLEVTRQSDDEGPPSGSVALFPGVQPLPASPPPIANLFAMLDPATADAPATDATEEDEDKEDDDKTVAALPAAETAPGEEAPEFVDVVDHNAARVDAAALEPEPAQDGDGADAVSRADQPSEGDPALDSHSFVSAEAITEAEAIKEEVFDREIVPEDPAAEESGVEDQAEVDNTPVSLAADETEDAGELPPLIPPPPPLGPAALEVNEELGGDPAEMVVRDQELEADGPADQPSANTPPPEVDAASSVEDSQVSAEPPLGAEPADSSVSDSDTVRPADAESVAEDAGSELAPENPAERSVMVEADLGEEIFVSSPHREEPDQSGLDALPPPVSRPALAPTLADLFNADGVTQVLLLERAGGVVFTSSKTPQLSMSQLAQHSLELFACADLVLGATDTGSEETTDALVAEGPSGCVLLQSVDDHFLVVCVDKSSGLGQVRFLVRRVLEPLRAVLAEE